MAATDITADEVRNRLGLTLADISDAVLAGATFILFANAWESQLLADNSKSLDTMESYETAILKVAKISKCAMQIVSRMPEEEVQTGPLRMKPLSASEREKLVNVLQNEIKDSLDMIGMTEKRGSFYITGSGGDYYHPSGEDDTQIDYSYEEDEDFRVFP